MAGILEAEDAEAQPEERRYRLPKGHNEALLELDSFYYMAPFARIMFGLAHPLPTVLEAYRTGSGVPYPAYGKDVRESIAHANRLQFVDLMGTEWLPAVSHIYARPQANPPVREADVGCGSGWSNISIARAYPKLGWTVSPRTRSPSSLPQPTPKRKASLSG